MPSAPPSPLRPAGLAMALALAALAGCSRSPAPAPGAAPATTAAPPGALPPLPVAPGGAFVTAAATLRREASEAPRVAGPGGKQVPNAVAVLQRGEPVTVLAGEGDWAEVRTSGDERGWLKRTALLEVEAAQVATVLQPADVFDRPDLLAVNARRKVEPGSLLLVVRRRPPFAEVNVGPGPNAWVLADRLVTEEQAVSVAKLAEKARWLKRAKKDDEARQVLALARQAFPGVPLTELLAQELGEAPAPGAPGAPQDGAAPPPTPP